MNIDKELDTRGLNCPLPILKAKKALAEMVSGQLLRVLSTDAGSTVNDRKSASSVVDGAAQNQA